MAPGTNVTFDRSSMETPVPSSESMVTFENSECSPTPGADMSSYSSPGSASDHMGASYAHHPQPLYPGSSVLSAFDKKKKQEQATHVNRVITTTKQAESEGSNASLTSINENKTEDPEPVVSASAGSTKKPPERRQKRLERNRESARLSRRRRKHYLEALEARVNQLSSDLDQLRRAHVLQGLPSIVQQRHQLIAQGLLPGEAISRTSPDLMIVNSFQAQQLKSFSIPPSTQFVLWLTLQNDHYFRGGRAASERLSAARIGERMLSSGTTKAVPSQSMWPLLCNEIGLSYDQEEKVRTFQRNLLQDSNSWLDRHSGFATKKLVAATHDAVQALTLRAGQRERGTASILAPEQRSKLLSWSSHNRDRMSRSTASVPPSYKSPLVQHREPSPQYHVSANLYILADRLNKVLETVPRAAPLITGKRFKKLSRRPCFESLSSCDEKPMHRENSSCSLKRQASEMSMEIDGESEGDENSKPPAPPPICPVDAEAKAAPTLHQALGFLQDLLPPAPEAPLPSSSAPLSGYIPVAVAPPPQAQPVREQPAPAPVLSYQSHFHQSAPTLGSVPAQQQQEQHVGHRRRSSFLPAHLNVVPEEMWPGDEAEDFLLDIIDEDDWAIGEGIDMDNL